MRVDAEYQTTEKTHMNAFIRQEADDTNSTSRSSSSSNNSNNNKYTCICFDSWDFSTETGVFTRSTIYCIVHLLIKSSLYQWKLYSVWENFALSTWEWRQCSVVCCHVSELLDGALVAGSITTFDRTCDVWRHARSVHVTTTCWHQSPTVSSDPAPGGMNLFPTSTSHILTKIWETDRTEWLLVVSHLTR